MRKKLFSVLVMAVIGLLIANVNYAHAQTPGTGITNNTVGTYGTTNLTLSPPTVVVGETIRFTATLQNTDTVNHTYQVVMQAFQPSGTPASLISASVKLAPGEVAVYQTTMVAPTPSTRNPGGFLFVFIRAHANGFLGTDAETDGVVQLVPPPPPPGIGKQ